MTQKRLVRSQQRIIGGVCGGVAEYLGIDPTPVRLAYVVFSFLGIGSPLLIYLIAWIIMPER